MMKKSKNNSPWSLNNRRWGILFILLILSPLANLLAGVLVAPTVIILSDKQRTGRMIIRNPGTTAQEVDIRMGFGIPTSDSLGNVRVDLLDSAVTDVHSAMDWVRPFPRKFTVPAGGSQTVRFVAKPPSSLEDGESWARIIVRSQERQTTQNTAEEGKITTRLNMIMQTAISLKYRKGDLFSKLEMTDAIVSKQEENVEVLIDLTNRGNVSYLGILNCRLLDADGNEVSHYQGDLAVYYDLTRRIDLPITGIRHRTPFQVEIYITNEGRSDIEPKDRIRGNEINYSMTVEP